MRLLYWWRCCWRLRRHTPLLFLSRLLALGAESFIQPGFTGISATGTNFADGFHFDAAQSSQSPPLGVLFNQVQYITGTYNFAGLDTLDFTVKGQAGPGGIHIFWQLMSGSDVLTTGTGRGRHQRR